MKTLNDLFLEELSDMYDAEHRMYKSLPRLFKAATCRELQQTLQNHIQVTEGHIATLERVFSCLDEKPKSRKCPAMAGIVQEAEDFADEFSRTPVVNAAIIAAVQKAEHYEIASYGCLRSWAILLGNEEAAHLLEDILDEEKMADDRLNQLSISKNQEALEEHHPATQQRH
jgi:ferritin-like metal-binding protein YciE